MRDCIFCRIVKNEAPSHKVWENENFLAFLTLGALNAGHTILIPKVHIDYVFEMPEPFYSEIFQAAKRLSKPLQTAMKSKRIGIIVEGFTVPHVHLHLVPLHNEDEIDPRRVIKMSAQELTRIAEKIKKETGNIQ